MRWVDKPSRSRVVVRGFEQLLVDFSVFAATPMIGALSVLLVLAALFGYTVQFCDVSSAFLHAPLSEEVFVEPPDEWHRPLDEHGHAIDAVWRLKKAMYGLKGSPKAWQVYLAEVITIKLPFKQCKTDSQFFFSVELHVHISVHMDLSLIHI